MKLKEILNKVLWIDIKCSLISIHNTDNLLDEYLKVFNKIKCIESKDFEGMKLYINKIIDDEGNEHVEVIGRNGQLQKESTDFEYFKDNINEEFANSEIDYALEMTPWEKWIDMDIPTTVLNNFSLPDIVAYCLTEMTLISYQEEEIQEKYNKLYEMAENIKSGKEVGIQIPLKDLLQLFEEEEDNNNSKYGEYINE